MINIRDLRIGNYYKASIEWVGSMQVQIDPVGEERIFILTEEKLLLILQFAPKSYEWIYPVEIGEDWLIKFGFIKRISSGHKESNFEYEKDELCFLCESIKLDKKNLYPYIYSKDEFIVFSFKPMPYVHQLQNLYRDLENKELIVK